MDRVVDRMVTSGERRYDGAASDRADWKDWLSAYEQRIDEYLAEVESLVNQDSPSSRKDLCDGVATYLAGRFEDLGAAVEREALAQCGDTLVARWPGTEPSLPPIVLVGHYDTVWPAGEAAKRPFNVSGGRATGPGTYDMKAGVALGMQVLRLVRERGYASRHPITFIVNGDEELGSQFSQRIWEREATGAARALVLEPCPSIETVWTGRKGTGIFELHIDGIPAHAGSNHAEGVSALEELAHQILALRSITDYGTGTTVNVGTASGGIARNVIAPHARALVDLRVTTPTEATRVRDRILGLRPVLPGAKLRVEGDLRRPPMVDTEANRELFQMVVPVAAKLGVTLQRAVTGGASDGNFTASVGTPTLDGLGVAGGGAHAYDEWFDVDSVPFKQVLLTALLGIGVAQ